MLRFILDSRTKSYSPWLTLHLVILIFQTTIEELLPPDQIILTVNATDADSDDNGRITYSLQGTGADDFYIDSSSGIIYNQRAIEYSPDRATVNLAIKAADGGM